MEEIQERSPASYLGRYRYPKFVAKEIHHVSKWTWECVFFENEQVFLR
jgi:hypothetical protein